MKSLSHKSDQFDIEQEVEQLIVQAFSDTDSEVRKNASDELGKIGSNAVLPLIEVIKHGDRKARYRATVILGQIRDERSVQALVALLKTDEIDNIRSRAAYALGELGDKQATDALIVALKDVSPEVRQTAVYALAKVGDAQVLPTLAYVQQYDQGEFYGEKVKEAAAEAIQQIEQRFAR